MKLHSTLPQRPGFMNVIPAFDLFALLLVFFLLGPSFLSQSGVAVELPVSRFGVDRDADASVVTLTPGNPPVIWLDRERVDLRRLVVALRERREASEGVPTLLLRSDRSIEAGLERQVAEKALQQGYRVILVGRNPEAGSE